MIRRALASAVTMTFILVAITLAMPLALPLMHWLYPDIARPIYTRASFATLLCAHLALVASATIVAGAVGISVGVAVTQPFGRPFASLARTIATLGQTFPPVAALALSVPLLGYGTAPTLAALIIYAALPILEATLAGLQSVPSEARDAAKGLGFSSSRRLVSVELPLAAPLLIAGLRNATIIGIGTATIGSSVGALSLGSPILEGLSASNPAYVVEGATVVAILAVTIDKWFDVLDAIVAQTLIIRHWRN